MPSVSNKQARLMAAAKHDPEVRERTGISLKVASDFVEADSESGRLSKAMKAKPKGKDALRTVRA